MKTEQTDKHLLLSHGCKYNGDSPFFKRLGEDLAGDGFTSIFLPYADDRSGHVDIDKKSTRELNFQRSRSEKIRQDYLVELTDTFNSVWTDRMMFEENIDGLYSVFSNIGSFESWPDEVKLLADHFREKGRIPVINPYGFSSDSFYHGEYFVSFLETLVSEPQAVKCKSKAEKLQLFKGRGRGTMSGMFSAQIGYLLGEIISAEVVPYDGRGGDITEALKTIDVDPEDAIVFVDDNILDLPNRFRNSERKTIELETIGFNRVEVYPICNCCYSGPSLLRPIIEGKGFNVSNTEFASDLFYGRLLDKIREQSSK